MEGMGPRLAVLVRFLVAALVVAGAAGALAIARGPGRSITYAGRSSAATALLLIAGMGLAAAGLSMQTARRTRRSGVVVLLAAFTWFAPVFVAWQNGPALVRSVAMVLAGLTFALVAHISLAYPGARIPSRPVRALVAAIYLEALVVAVALALFRDPYFDPSCWANCTVNSFLVHSLPSFTHRVEVIDRWFVIAAAVAVIATSVNRLRTASRPALAGLLAVCLPAILFAGAAGARSIALQNIAVEDPFNNTMFAIFVISAAALIMLAAGLVWSLIRRQQQRRAVAQIVANLDDAPAPGSVQAALAHALKDPELRIAYWLPHAGRYVDATGKAVPDPISPPGRFATRLLRDGRTIAVILHADAAGELEAQIGPAVLLGLENERLQADVLAQLEELRSSRVRVVETADAERRALERDLHDGARSRRPAARSKSCARSRTGSTPRCLQRPAWCRRSRPSPMRRPCRSRSPAARIADTRLLPRPPRTSPSRRR
jgi:hypothetical protein